MKDLPKFKYLLNPIESGVFETDKTVKCDCCGKETSLYYCGPIYGDFDEDPKLCPNCIKEGKANQWYMETFEDESGLTFFDGDYEDVNDEAKIKELLHCTPAHFTWQSFTWPAHCDDFCQFISFVYTKKEGYLNMPRYSDVSTKGYMTMQELKEAGIWDKVAPEDFDDVESREEFMEMDHALFYLYKCLYCDTYRLLWDCS